jgi:Concanavalin A-like lectin/glucanases superfamily
MKPIFALVWLSLPAFAAFPNGYTYCKVVTTQHSMVSGASDLTNYPLTVILNDGDLRAVANGGLVNNGSGFDIGFYPDCSGSGAALKWEMESYSATTGAIVAHVLRPTLSHTTDDTIGMYYGGSFSSFQSTASAVWDATFTAVYHLPDGTALNTADSTTSVNNGTNSGATPAVGKIDGGASFAGAPYIVMGTNGFPSGVGPLTLEAWFKPSSLPATYGAVVSMGDVTVAITGVGIYAYGSNIVIGGAGNAVEVIGALSVGTWYHAVCTYDGTQERAYLNGVELPGSPLTKSFNITRKADFERIGDDGYGDTFSGVIDEVRILNSARSADWILTEYRNQSAPGTYIAGGPRLGQQGGRVRHVVIGGN